MIVESEHVGAAALVVTDITTIATPPPVTATTWLVRRKPRVNGSREARGSCV